jgi:hypothetical protein
LYKRNIWVEAEEAYDKAFNSMEQCAKSQEGWEEAVTRFDKDLFLFKDGIEQGVQRRKHVSHCTHDISFEDFVFLMFGPLE